MTPISALRSLALATLAVAPACGPSSNSQDPAPSMIRVLSQAELEEAVLPRDGEKAVLLNFWATWCGPCIAEMPHLIELHEEWKDRGVRIQTIALDVQLPMNSRENVKTADDIASWMERKGWEIPVIVPGEESLSVLQNHFNLSGSIPVTLVMDASGEVVARQIGATTRKGFEKMIERAL